MSSDATAIYPLGQAVTDDYGAQMLGVETWFPDIDFASAVNPKPAPRTGLQVHAILVMNDSGGTLTPGLFVTWKAGYVGTRVGALAGVGSAPAGQVDPYISGTVADGDAFWLIVDGPTEVIPAAEWSAGASLMPAASGELTINTRNSIGVAIAAAAAGDVSGNLGVRAVIQCGKVGAPGPGSTGILAVAPTNIAAGAGGAISVAEYYTSISTDAGGDAFTLANGTFVGQLKKIQLIVDGGGNGVVTPANLAGGTTITFADAGDFCILVWDGTDWVAVELGNDADGATAPALA